MFLQINVPINVVKNVYSLSNKMFTRNVAINVHFEAAFKTIVGDVLKKCLC